MSTRIHKLWIVWLIAIGIGAIAAACHGGDDENPAQVPPTWTDARTLPGHVAHLGKTLDAGVKIGCKDCHDTDKHGFASPGVAPCAKCHEQEDKQHHHGGKNEAGTPHGETTCLTCHVFAPHEGKAEAPTCVSCHAEPNGKLAHHARKDVACTTCHAPHQKPDVTLAACTTCHTGVSAVHGTMSVSATSDAGVDATFAPDDAASHAARKEALKAADFVANEGAHEEKGDAALATTAAGMCTTCHAPHSGKEAAKETCTHCHVGHDGKADAPWDGAGPVPMQLAAAAPKIHPVQPKGHDACTTCHAPHAAKKELVAACGSCHEERKAVAAVAGHATCTGCHQPHSPLNAPLSCTNCHKEHPALGATKVEAHARCTSCHDVHQPTKSPTATCAGCHDKVHPTHPSQKTTSSLHAVAAVTPSITTQCTSCHQPHPAASGVIVKTCSSCHTLAKTDTSFHAQGDTKVKCAQCHQPHAFDLKSAGPKLCGSCHATKAAAVAKQPGHAKCASCHGVAHSPTKELQCEKCHSKETHSTLKGHDVCTKCHEPHAGTLVDPSGKTVAMAITPAFCGGCHTEKPKALHGGIAGGCANCHRPHGPEGVASPPTCTTCHDKTKLPGLHASPSHATCTNCHGSHAPPKSDRDTCTATCHTKQKNHQPGAAVCKGCHVFRK